MLLQFRVKNYKSIADEIVLDMTATSLNEHSGFLAVKNGVKILKVASLYGANASGKTNVLDAFYEFVNLVKNSHRISINKLSDIESGDSFKYLAMPFCFNEKRNEPTEFEMHFVIDDKEYKYGFISHYADFIEEWLYERKFSKNETKWKAIFERRKNTVYTEFKKYDVLKGYEHLIDKMLLLTFLENKKIKDADVFHKILKQFNTAFFMAPRKFRQQFILEKYYKDKKLLQNFKSFLEEVDPCIKDFMIEAKEDAEGKMKYAAYAKHNGSTNKHVFFDWQLESAGTQRVLDLYYFLHSVLHDGGIWVADELDYRLHPLVFRKILKMFRDEKTNLKDAQIIFSSHNLILLDNRELRRDEIWFVEKDENGYTKITSLAEFKTNNKVFRSDLDYGKNYLAGRFGAIPFQGEENING